MRSPGRAVRFSIINHVSMNPPDRSAVPGAAQGRRALISRLDSRQQYARNQPEAESNAFAGSVVVGAKAELASNFL